MQKCTTNYAIVYIFFCTFLFYNNQAKNHTVFWRKKTSKILVFNVWGVLIYMYMTQTSHSYIFHVRSLSI